MATGSMTSGSLATSSTLKPGSVLKVASSSFGLSGSAKAGEEINHRDTEAQRRQNSFIRRGRSSLFMMALGFLSSLCLCVSVVSALLRQFQHLVDDLVLN